MRITHVHSKHNPLFTAFLFFLLLELVHAPLGLYFKQFHNHYGPQDGKDFLIMPILVSVYYLFLLFLVKKWHSEFILGLSHIAVWLPGLVWEGIDPGLTNCVNCERFRDMISILNGGCMSSPFSIFYKNHNLWPQWFQTVVLDLLLMAFYLYCMARLAKYIAFKLSNLFRKKVKHNSE